jgi:hypothetical protein
LANQNKLFGQPKLAKTSNIQEKSNQESKDFDDATMRSKSSISNRSHLDNLEPHQKKKTESKPAEGGFFGNPSIKVSQNAPFFGDK